MSGELTSFKQTREGPADHRTTMSHKRDVHIEKALYFLETGYFKRIISTREREISMTPCKRLYDIWRGPMERRRTVVTHVQERVT